MYVQITQWCFLAWWYKPTWGEPTINTICQRKLMGQIFCEIPGLFSNSRTSQDFQSFPHKNHCRCNKKLAARLWPVLFTLTVFLNIHSPLLQQNKNLMYHCFPQQIRPLFNHIHYKTILVWGLILMWLTNATCCLQYTTC